jgi:hypothetical protein
MKLSVSKSDNGRGGRIQGITGSAGRLKWGGTTRTGTNSRPQDSLAVDVAAAALLEESSQSRHG